MSHSLRSRHDDRGVVALELVLAVLPLLMLILGAVVLGNFLSIKTQTTGLARDGARTAALGKAVPADMAVVVPADAVVEIVGDKCPTPADPTKFVTVQATKNVTLRSFPLVPVDFLPATTTETVTMRCGG